MTAPTLLAVGTRTPESGGRGVGLATWWWTGDAATSTPIDHVDLASPTFLAQHPTLPLLYATSELDDGVVSTVTVAADGTLRVIDERPTGGSGPAHLCVAPDGKHLLVAHYGDGTLAPFALNESGRIVSAGTLVRHHGHGPDPDRQDAPHVHQVVPAGDEFLVCDLGNDTITAYRFDGDDLVVVSQVLTPAGSGPRHLAQMADGETAFVTAELDNGLLWFERDAATPWSLRYRVPAAGPLDPDAEVVNQPSHLEFTDDEQYVLVGNRGKNRITVFDVGGGEPIFVCDADAGWPRHFTQVGPHVLVASQREHRITVLHFDRTAETLVSAGELAVDSPMCLLPLRTPTA